MEEAEEDYYWLMETVSMSTIANMLIFTGMPVLGSLVALAACLEPDLPDDAGASPVW